MTKHEFTFVCGCMALLGASLFYMLCDFGSWPLLAYLPYEHRWQIAKEAPSPSAILYPGMLLWGFAGGLLGGGSSALFLHLRRPSLSHATLILMSAWAWSTLVWTAMYFLWGLWPF